MELGFPPLLGGGDVGVSMREGAEIEKYAIGLRFTYNDLWEDKWWNFFK